ncbi:MAG: hypothetical protein J0H56_05580 [Micrococcales bacterium]|nr:hypothetical protein [Micrococcales bacterium]
MNPEDTGLRQSGLSRYFIAKRILQIVAFALVLIPAIVLLIVPVYNLASSDSTGDSSLVTATLLDVNGPGILILFSIPVIAAGVPLFVHGRTWTVLSIVAAAVLGLWVVAGLLTIGIYFIPAFVTGIIAACLSRQPRSAQASGPLPI